MDNKQNRKFLPPVIVLALFLLIWQAAVRIFDIDAYVLPSPASIVKQGLNDWSSLLQHMKATLGITLLGFGIGAVLGFLLAALLHIIPGAKAGFYPLLVLTQNVPLMALGPLLVIWFGFGMMPRVVLITLVTFFPVVVAMLTGLTQCDPKLMNYMRMIGAKRAQLFWRLELPSSVPHLFSGLKIAASYSVISAIYAESIGSNKGLGYYILLKQRGFETAKVFAAVAVIVMLSLILFGAITLLERMFVRGRVPSTSSRLRRKKGEEAS
ncbi:ABC-type nitrate/sulfonate/bicarbonate transport system permease component [Paenibacillus taihuensis]|uniref:ABC-type nitrate/sulfonate/bicarbonate transport system permease component n=1 Tax=Paenibacillus taihuensis TaxID=1156355 RepID=A0A3D9SEL7_9BACL|nr:ABC transporter permease [Paenibacillus taihuensis]REE94332.1 ABC-type nitrate/sulfonate/bicarbonate transport system permease component [Paenibacillus taihuensis]